MGNSDDIHFDSYRDQTKLKHQLLVEYLPAYYNVMKTWHKNLVFIDGFAGQGHYLDDGVSVPGSPIRAMELFAANEDFRTRLACAFVEHDAEYFERLERAVNDQQNRLPLVKRPIVFRGAFSEFMTHLRTHLLAGNELAPTFLFVDPCGVDGVKMDDLAEVLARPRCELFLFFNYAGVNRIAGRAQKEGSSPTLRALLGAQSRVDRLVAELADKTPVEREETIVSHFISALQEAARAEYVIPFRVECEEKASASHHLLHATKNPLGFKIMKSVMSNAVRSRNGSGLELLQASNRKGRQLFEHPSVQLLRQAILAELATQPRRVSFFSNDWMSRPTDMFSEADYKAVIVVLEQEGKLSVWDKENAALVPPSKRMRKDKVTLGDGCWLRLG